MSTEPKSEFLLLFRNTQFEKQLSLETMQEAMQRFTVWLDRWTQAGVIKAGQPLGDEGKVLSKSKGVADGPFAEAKEAVGGYMRIQAGSFEEAVKVASEWPLMDYGASVEVRPIVSQCETMRLLGMEMVALGG